MTVKQLMTAEDLWEMPEIPGKRFDLVDGQLVEITGIGAVHGPIVELILRAVGGCARTAARSRVGRRRQLHRGAQSRHDSRFRCLLRLAGAHSRGRRTAGLSALHTLGHAIATLAGVTQWL